MKEISKEVLEFLNLHGKYLSITQIPKEASNRTYYRVYYEEGSKILCIDQNFSSLPYAFLEVQKYLEENDIPVPKIFAFEPKLNLILQSDEGETDLTSLSEEEYTTKIYSAIDIILKLQKLKPIKIISSKSFDYKKLSFEINTTLEAYKRFAKTYHTEDIFINPSGLEFLDNSIKFLASYPNMVVTHRDFHARNLLISKHGLCIIDFQDMIMGSVQYDLASLLYDAYRPLSLQKREIFYEYFKEKSIYKNYRFREYYLIQCLQRSFKALGTYLIMFHERGYEKYKESIPKCLENLLEITQIGGFPDSLHLFFYFLQKRLENF